MTPYSGNSSNSSNSNPASDSSDDGESIGSMPGLQERAREDSSSDEDSDAMPDLNIGGNNNRRRGGSNRNRNNTNRRRRDSQPIDDSSSSSSSSSDDDDDDDDDIPELATRYGVNGNSDSDSDSDSNSNSDIDMPNLVGRSARNNESSDSGSSSNDSVVDVRPTGGNFRRPGSNRNNNHANGGLDIVQDEDDDDVDDVPPNLISRTDQNDDTSSESDDSDAATGADNIGWNTNVDRNPRRSNVATNRTGATTTTAASSSTNGAANPAAGTAQKRKKRTPKQRKADKAKAKREEAKREKKKREIIAAARERIHYWILKMLQQNKYSRLRSAAILIQAFYRGIQTRKANTNIIQHVSEFKQFYKVWGGCIRLSKTIERDVPDWAALREKQAYIRQQELMRDDEEEMKATDAKMTSSMADAMRTMEGKAAKLEDDIEEVLLPISRTVRSANKSDGGTSSIPLNFKRIHFSGDVVRWIRRGDPKYVGLFVKRMRQLSGGERSRILAKRLNGSTTSKVPIYETYLEQKSGQRILWTEKDDYLLVWYVTSHDRVSRLMRLIDDSKNRSTRQRVSMNDMNEFDDGSLTMNGDDNSEDEHEIFLDPLGNVPLKVYDIGINDIEEIKQKNWTPALHLTDEERKVVETEGTVLLLGRSGTGKTICICNRMEYDRQKFKQESTFSQLFVARSPRLCTYVKSNIGESEHTSEFVTFEQLLEELENVLPRIHGARNVFPENKFMRFSTFKREVYDGDKGVDALIVWTNIRSFIKGSIEAMKDPNSVVSEDEYLSEHNFGKKRCRLLPEQRKIVYEIFLKYQESMKESGAWDNCDRIIALNRRFLAAKKTHTELFENSKIENYCKWSKIYVDEVQDYTQAEILLFFRLSGGAGNLFLAGDPAQNVTKGVEFRFEDIRSVGYHIADGDRRLIPDKPQKVNVNFRSHAGILNAASFLLTKLFRYFPNAAKELGKDDGLFGGPRPGIYNQIKPEIMTRLVQKDMHGTVVLTHDENIEECIAKLGGYELVYGIRRAKGLEFKSVIILDFFSSLPADLQKPWREFLLGRADVNDLKRDFPQLEGQLKLLYTAVTRCIDRLYFAETTQSISGDAFVKIAKTEVDGNAAIATLNKIGEYVNMTLTQDEVLVAIILLFSFFSMRIFFI